MDINDILNSLGLDFSNPEVKRGAVEAIEAILASRATGDAGGAGGGGQTVEVELDPDLVMPSVKQQQALDNDDDVEVEDEEDLLSKIKHKESEDPIDDTNSTGNDSDSDKESDDSRGSNDDDSAGAHDKNNKQSDDDDTEGEASKENDLENSAEDDEESDASNTSDEAEENDVANDDTGTTNQNDTGKSDGAEATDDTESAEDDDDGELDSDGDGDDSDDDGEDDIGSDDGSFEDEGESDDSEDGEEELDDEEVDWENSDFGFDDEPDFDEEDLVDDDLENSAEDDEEKTKQKARRIKRERTLAAAQKALTDAKAKNVSPALIRELEKSIEALEALTEAVTKSLKNISDAEFNQLINRVFDAIQACGDSSLTFTSEEEREARVKEIKDDMAKAETQAELSAEDVTKIRAETQAIKAREKETAKYTQKARGSFKGFQEFLTSLQKAIALQVATEETRDDSWSAINRRYGGTGILQPGKKVQELQNKRIPIIDFYFDCSLSWDADDIKVGKKAVAALADMEEKGQIKVNVYYFSDRVSQSYEDVEGGSTSAWNYIVKNIIATQANNVVVMTDSDMENQGRFRADCDGHLKYTVPGYVWYLWKNGANAPRLPRDLRGRDGVQQFSFNTSDA